MYEIETALLYFQDGTKQFTDQRDTSLCVTFVGMFLLREALNTLLRQRVTDKQKLKEIKDILFFRPGKLSLPHWPLEGLAYAAMSSGQCPSHDIFHIKTPKR